MISTLFKNKWIQAHQCFTNPLRRVECIWYATWRFGHTLNSKHSAKTTIKNRQDISVIIAILKIFFLFAHFFFFFTFLYFFSFVWQLTSTISIYLSYRKPSTQRELMNLTHMSISESVKDTQSDWIHTNKLKLK